MKILICTDGSYHSKRVVKEAADFTEAIRNCEVTVINVYNDMAFNGYVHTYKEEGEKILAESVKVFAAKNIKVKALLLGGNPIQVILQVAQEYDMLILGSRGRGGLKAMILGSVSNAVLQATNKKVLIIK
jgi:nucleotide-binding universal stress UspA family protein